MDALEVHEIARRLFEALGTAAIAEAAQKAAACEQAGEQKQAVDWRRIEKALREMRGPKTS